MEEKPAQGELAHETSGDDLAENDGGLYARHGQDEESVRAAREAAPDPECNRQLKKLLSDDSF